MRRERIQGVKMMVYLIAGLQSRVNMTGEDNWEPVAPTVAEVSEDSATGDLYPIVLCDGVSKRGHTLPIANLLLLLLLCRWQLLTIQSK